MAVSMRDGGRVKRGRGRPAREPELLPANCAYEAWLAVHGPYLERLLVQLDREQAEWTKFEGRSKAAAAARAQELVVVDPVPPRSMFRWLRGLATLPEAGREAIVENSPTHRVPMPTAVILCDHHGRVRALQSTITKMDIMNWLVGQAVHRGLVCDFANAYQAWFVFADLLLRDADIGAIIAEIHPERCSPRSPRMSAEELRELNADLARKERKRVNAKRSAFGYDVS
jgi:hypothetical protein